MQRPLPHRVAAGNQRLDGISARKHVVAIGRVALQPRRTSEQQHTDTRIETTRLHDTSLVRQALHFSPGHPELARVQLVSEGLGACVRGRQGGQRSGVWGESRERAARCACVCN